MATATAVPPSTSTPTSRPSAGRSQSQPLQSLSSPAAKTPVYFAPTSHLDPSAYVRGTHAINIGAEVLIHPRAHLVSIHAPLTINEGSIVAEKSIVGGPLPPPSSLSGETPATPSSPPPSNETPTLIGRSVYIHPNVTINAGAKIGDFTVLESNVTIQHGVVVGEHTKICAGVTLTRDVPDWTVVYGLHGERRRRRYHHHHHQPQQQSPSAAGGEGENVNDRAAAETVEAARLRMMNAERDSTVAILKKAASRTIASRSKR